MIAVLHAVDEELASLIDRLERARVALGLDASTPEQAGRAPQASRPANAGDANPKRSSARTRPSGAPTRPSSARTRPSGARMRASGARTRASHTRKQASGDRKRAAGAGGRPSRAGNATRAELLDYIVEHAPVSRRQILQALGGSQHAIDRKLSRMLEDGEILDEGSRKTRRFRPSNQATHLHLLAIADGPLPPRGVHPMYDAVEDLGGATTEQLADHLDLPADVVVAQGRRLTHLGLLRYTGVGGKRMWVAAKSRGQRDAA